ncbi:hypothetical protein FRAHR75_1180005 [Frankia sp. Hr75.2]|nr:hypothetical protein FRAHR75_1180005 [Frankia sp. Hr75.2]
MAAIPPPAPGRRRFRRTPAVATGSRRVSAKNVQGNLFADGWTGMNGMVTSRTVDPGKRDVEIKVLIDCAADEIERVRRLLDDVLGIGGLLVPRYVETATA